MEEGNWIGPTILDNVQSGSEAATVELFGPIISIIRCKDISEAMKIENILTASHDGVVVLVRAGKGESLSVDQVIMEFE